jgi:hypothetical protein
MNTTFEKFWKDPDAILDYVVDWNDATDPWLEAGETISSYTVTVASGLTLVADSELDGRVTVWLSGGTVGNAYTVTVHIVSSVGREDDRSFRVVIVQR